MARVVDRQNRPTPAAEKTNVRHEKKQCPLCCARGISRGGVSVRWSMRAPSFMGEAARRRADGEASGCDSELGVGLRGPAKGGGMLEGRRHASSSLLHRFMAPGWVRVQKKSEEKDKKKQVFFGRESYRAFLFW